MKSDRSETQESRIQMYSLEIGKAWNKSLEGIFAAGDLLIKARKEFGSHSDEFANLRQSLPFSTRTAQELAAIAADSKLRDPDVQHLLPPHWGTLAILKQYTPQQFQESIARGDITASMERSEAEDLLKRLRSGSAGIASPTSTNTTAKKEYQSALIFSVPKDLAHRRALLDLHFIYTLVSELFQNSPDDLKIKVEFGPGFKLTEKENSSLRVYQRLIALVRRLDNHKRKIDGKSNLNAIQRVLRLLGADPDRLGEAEFSLLERLAINYAEEVGVTFLTESNFKWFSAKTSTEPELLGSFLTDVEKYISSVTGENSETEIIQLDGDIEAGTDAMPQLANPKGPVHQ